MWVQEYSTGPPCLVYRHHVLSREVLGEGVDSRSSCGEVGLEISDGESVTRLETIQNRVIRYVDAVAQER